MSEATGRITPEQFSQFLQEIELQDIILVKARFTRTPLDYKIPSGNIEFSLNVDANYRNFEAETVIEQTYKLKGKTKSRIIVSLEVQYAIRFTPAIFNDDLFVIYNNMILMKNTFSYFREFVQSQVSRMGFPSLTLPLLTDMPIHGEDDSIKSD